jgi:DeoR family myo-inositol catabolism operon transcriptional repressor
MEMIKTVRIKQMERYIVQNGFVTIIQLCEQFNVSKNTVRSDISELVEKGVVEKKYGGVAAIATNVYTTFSERKITNMGNKEAIGQEAARLLEEGDVIFVDSGTTTTCLLNNASEFPDNITIITNNLKAIQEAEKYNEITVIVLSGRLERKTNSFTGLETIEGLKQYNFTKCFIGATGISLNGELSNSTLIEANIKKEVLQRSDKVYLMLDSMKIGKSVMVNFANIKQVDAWICDDTKQEVTEELCARLGVNIIIAKA